MSNCSGAGRFGNQVIRSIAFSLIAEKHDLCVTYQTHDAIEKLGIKLYTNFMSLLNNEIIDFNFKYFI